MLAAALLCSATISAQSTKVSGTVADRNGEPLTGVTVFEEGTNNGTVTNSKGEYTLSLRNRNSSLAFQILGYTDHSESVAGRTVIDVKMEESAVEIDAVVAIGYGTVRQKDLTTAVSIVSTEDIDTRPLNTVSGALQGKAAGVQVIQPSGLPGEGMVVRVRGASSISSSNDPLYVVDGVPVGDGNYSIAYLSPNEIETMQVLKDASSAAIYGSRAANGVVLITTKRSVQNRAPKVTFSSYLGISQVSKTYDVLNTAQYKELMDETGYASLPDGLTDNTDWFKETYQNGVNQNYQFSFSNGDERNSYYVGGGYTGETGIIRVAYSNRYNINANFTSKLYDWLKVGFSTDYSRYQGNGIISGTGPNRAGVVLSVVTTPTYAKPWSDDNPDYYWTEFYGANVTTPSENMARTENNTSTTDRMLLSGDVQLFLAKGLTFKSTTTMDRRWVHSSSFLDPIHTSYGRTQHGEASDSRSDDMRMVYDNILTYNIVFGQNRLELMGGTSATVSTWEELWGSRSYFSDDYDNAIIGLNGGNKGGLRGQSQNKSAWAIMSYLARASYNYADKYLLTANFRADGSSKLAPKGRWGYFPSFSAAWRLSSEEFMKDIEVLSDLKLRAGWGQTGNQSGLDDYAYLQKYNTNYYDWTDKTYADATPTVGSKSNIKNEDLTWETTTQTNVGVDIALLNNRLTMSIDAYYKYTSDMLMNVPLPDPNPSIYRNEGEMSNRGIELSLSSVNVAAKDFRWTTDFNISFNRNRLEKLNLQQVYYYAQTSEALSENVVRVTPGKALSMFWGYKSLGVDPETGDIIYEDLDNNNIINSSDKQYIGDANPKFTFGMTNNFSYHGFNLNILLTGSYGNDIYNASRIEMTGMYNAQNQTTEVLRRWKVPGQVTDVPRAGNLDNLKASTRWIEDGSYLKVKNITLSYNYRSAWLKSKGIGSIQPYVTLNNIFTLTNYSGYDPEVSQYSNSYNMGIDWGTYPHVKSFVAGINVEF